MKSQVKSMVARHRPWDVVRFITHLPNFAKLFFRLMGDGRVHWIPKALLLLAGAYAISPLDFLPDLMPLLGQVDDLTIVAMACRMFLRLCPQEVVQEHVSRIDGQWESPV